MGDIGTPAHHLVRYITGSEISDVCADAGALLRFEGGARGSFWVTQAAAGVENCLRIRVSGTEGTLEWMQELPQQLLYKPFNSPMQIRTPNSPGTLPAAARASRIVAGHPEGFPEAFATLYSDAAEAIAASIAGTECDPLALTFPDSRDGLSGVRFIHAVLESSAAGGKWTGADGRE
jgi:predicted dehydrogenase